MHKKIKGSFLALALGLSACNSNVIDLKQTEDVTKSLTTNEHVVDLNRKGFGIKATASLNGNITAGGRVAYTFSGKAGQVLRLEMLGKFDTYLEVRNGNANGTIIKENDDSAGNLQAGIYDYILPYTGTYGIVARGYDTRAVGNYTLNFNLNDVAGPKPRWETVITQAESQAGAGLGNATSSIQQISGGYMRSYSGANGAGAGVIIYNTARDTAYWVHGGIYFKFLEKGGISVVGRPTSNEIVGLRSQITGHNSVYQTFDGNANPSIQYDSTTDRAYLLLDGIRRYWLNNPWIGQPTSDELQNPIRQNFEGATIYWNNGQPSFNDTTKDNTCINYPVGKPAGTFNGYYDYQPFGVNRHLGLDLNGLGGKDTDLGDSIYSIANNMKIISARNEGKGWGNVVIGEFKLKGKTYNALFAHLQTIYVKAGDTVNAKALIGTMGKGYNNNEYFAHLHFETRKGSNFAIGKGYGIAVQGQIDPMSLIRNNRCN